MNLFGFRACGRSLDVRRVIDRKANKGPVSGRGGNDGNASANAVDGQVEVNYLATVVGVNGRRKRIYVVNTNCGTGSTLFSQDN